MKLILNNIKKSFEEKQVLKGASFSFEQGKIYGLLGRNGAGKTTLFNCLSSEIEAESGEALLATKVSDHEESQEERTKKLEADDIGYVFSTPIVPEFLTGYEFLKFFIDINKDKVEKGKTIDDYFDLVKIDKEDRHRLIKGYSHGMKNKLQMLCFIISKPPVILLDEPLTSFDVVVALEMKKLLREMKEDHIIIFSTHILQLATDLCDEIVVLSNGELVKIDNDKLHSSDFENTVLTMLQDDEERKVELQAEEEQK